MKEESVIKVTHLYKKFGHFTANDDLNFDVHKGEIFGFLGANGAGKTTAMRILCGLSVPTSGEVIVAGVDVGKYPEKVKRKIGYMSQKFSLYEDLTIWENMRLFAGIYGVERKRFNERGKALLIELDLWEQRNRLISSLSLGWKQKLAFMVAMIHEPQIVFLDEPTSGVDPITRRQFWEMIYEAASNDVTIFITTHYMDEAEYCDRVSIMVNGKIEALDSPARLMDRYEVESMDKLFVTLTR